jgi:hypothetical protein
VCREYLSDVLHDEGASGNLFPCAEAPAFASLGHGINVGILMFLKFSVGAKFSAVAGVLIAFGGHHSIEASITAVIGNVVILDAGVFLASRSTEAGLHLVVFGHFPFAIQVDIFLERSEVFKTISEVVEPDLVVLDESDHLGIRLEDEDNPWRSPCVEKSIHLSFLTRRRVCFRMVRETRVL